MSLSNFHRIFFLNKYFFPDFFHLDLYIYFHIVPLYSVFSFLCLSRVSSSTTIQKHPFFGGQPSLWSSAHFYISLLIRYHWSYQRGRQGVEVQNAGQTRLPHCCCTLLAEKYCVMENLGTIEKRFFGGLGCLVSYLAYLLSMRRSKWGCLSENSHLVEKECRWEDAGR